MARSKTRAAQPKKPVGRPTVLTPETLTKLKEVFALGGTDEEACFYSEIGTSTLYNYQQAHPEFVEQKEALKNRPILKARQTVVKALDDTHTAQWYLERKRKAEFSARTELTGEDGKSISFQSSDLEAVLSLLPEDRQDQVYAIITDALTEAEELQRRGIQNQGIPS